MKNWLQFPKVRFSEYSVPGLHVVLQIVVAISNFIISPMIINNLGTTPYTLWITINAFAGLLLMADWGFLNTFRVSMTEIYLQNNFFAREMWKMVTRTLHFSAAMGVVALAILLHGMQLIPQDSQSRNILLVIIAILTAYFTLLEHLYIVKYQVLGFEIKSTSILIVDRIFEGIFQIIFLIIHPDLYTIFVLTLIFRFGSFMTLFLCLPRTSHILQSNIEYQVSMLKVVKQSTGAFMFVLSNVAYANILTLVLSKMLATEFFIVVQLSRTIVSPIRMIGSSISLGTLQNRLKETFYKRLGSPTLEVRNELHIFYILSISAIILSLASSHIWNIFFPNISGFNPFLVSLFAFQYVLDSLIWMYSRDFYNANRLFKLGFCNLLLSGVSVLSIPFVNLYLEVVSVPLTLILFDLIFLFLITNQKGKKWLYR